MVGNPYRKLITFIESRDWPTGTTNTGLCFTIIEAERASFITENEERIIKMAISKYLDDRNSLIPSQLGMGACFVYIPSVMRKVDNVPHTWDDHQCRMEWLKRMGDAWEDWVIPSPMFD